MNVYQTMKPSDGNLSIITMTIIIITVIISASLMSNTTVYLYLSLCSPSTPPYYIRSMVCVGVEEQGFLIICCCDKGSRTGEHVNLNILSRRQFHL